MDDAAHNGLIDHLGSEVELIFNVNGTEVKLRTDNLFQVEDNKVLYIESKFTSGGRVQYTKGQETMIPLLVQSGDEGLPAVVGAKTGGGPLIPGTPVTVVVQVDIYTNNPALLGKW